MSDATTKPRPRSAARRANNAFDKRPPREFICLVGSPTNVLNGWVSVVSLKNGVRPEITNGDDRYFQVGQARPRTEREVVRYLTRGPECPPAPFHATPWNGSQDKEEWSKAWRAQLSPEEWEHYGWSGAALDMLIEHGWTPGEIESSRPGTHDLYWANFLRPAERLYAGGRFPPEIERPHPQQGDIVTFIVWQPGYDQRRDLDWKVSPNNPENMGGPSHGSYLGPYGPPPAPMRPRKAIEGELALYHTFSLSQKAQVLSQLARDAGKPITEEQARQYLIWEGEQNPLFGRSSLPDWEQRMILRNALQRVLAGQAAGLAGGPIAQRAESRKQQRARELDADGRMDAKLNEAQIDRSIYARSIGENLRPGPYESTHSLGEVLLTTGQRKPDGSDIVDIQVKLLLADSHSAILEYFATGAWSGQPLQGERPIPPPPPPTRDAWVAALPPDDKTFYLDLSEEDRQQWYDGVREKQEQAAAHVNYTATILKEAHKIGYWNRHWAPTPAVDRKKVKIVRFDYIGHSYRNEMLLEYGWYNEKGELPGANVSIEAPALDKMFSGGVTTPDAIAVLWGCNLGVDEPDSIARVLSDKHYFAHVIGADSSTDFHKIADGGAMPEPSSWGSSHGNWVTYPKPPP